MPSTQSFDFGSETGQDSVVSTAALEAKLEALNERIEQMRSETGDEIALARLNKEAASLLLSLNRREQAWRRARPLFDQFIQSNSWEDAAEICDILFCAEQADSLAALGQGVWLAVTFPVKPELTLAMLQHVIDETPDDSDGAAVAAAAAAYVCEIRKHLADSPDLYLQTMQMLTTVARRHSDVKDQKEFDEWTERLELRDPDKFLVRLRNVVDVLVQDEWWFDRESVQAQLP